MLLFNMVFNRICCSYICLVVDLDNNEHKIGIFLCKNVKKQIVKALKNSKPCILLSAVVLSHKL